MEHLFTHALIAYPHLAFADNNFMKKHYDADCLTSGEFLKILESLHKNNYVLVDINDCYKTKNNITIKQKIKVPNGKKALILSFDDINYDSKKQGLGMVDKIILDKKGNIATSFNHNNKIELSYDKEFVNILENFLKLHPDFSPYGARGTICLTGYDGILGYRTSHTNIKTRQSEIKLALSVVNKLKSLGWTFACHSYGHYHMNKISLDKFTKELELWKSEVEPLIGKTNLYVYPYGEWSVFENGEPTAKHKLLENYGFKLFLGVGMKTFYSYLPSKNNIKVLFMDRKCLDGTTLRANSKELNNFFKPLEILDKTRPI